ncbi:MAG: hypothetical protein M0Q96_05090 [Candidatus Omnitrophica bacterium]|jgi:hypothetical protein|nr:hypothetical protein [Candidatus Omnitrophota bacterium]
MSNKTACLGNLILKLLGILILLAAAFDVTQVSDNVLIFWAIACFIVAAFVKKISKSSSCCK